MNVKKWREGVWEDGILQGLYRLLLIPGIFFIVAVLTWRIRDLLK